MTRMWRSANAFRLRWFQRGSNLLVAAGTVLALASAPHPACAGPRSPFALGADGGAAPAITLVADHMNPRGSPGRRGGGAGRALGIIGGALLVGKALEAADRQQKEKKTRDKPARKPRGGTVVVKTAPEDNGPTCRGGRVRAGKCVCDRSETRKTIGRRAYVCVDGGPKIETAKEPTPERRSPPINRTVEPPKTPPPVLAAEPTPAAPSPTPVADASAGDFVPDQVLLTFAPATPASTEQAVAQEFGLEVRERLDSSLLGVRVVVYALPKGRSVPSTLAALRSDQRFAAPPQENFLYRHQGGPSDVLSSNDLQYALAKVEAPQALAMVDGPAARVAVIDSAVDARHPDLASAIEDIFDATGEADYAPDAHGTAVAGIIKARGAVRGLAPDARLLAIRAFKPRGAGETAVTTSFILLRGLDWAIAQNARVVNLSFVGPHDPLFARAIKAAYDRRAIIVAAAGNNGPGAPPAYPAAYDEVIAVTATDAADQLYENANRGEYIAVAAPGVDVLVLGVDGGHEFQSGTSFAAPHVTAIIALMLERDPSLTTEGARRALAGGAQDLGAPGKDKEFGAGRVNAPRAIDLLERTTATAADKR